MINGIWLFLVVVGYGLALFNGNVDAVTKALIDATKTAVELSIGLIGIMALWLGIMKIAEEAGLVTLLARMLKPIMVRLFPEVPPEHPAMGAMIMNMAANILGLGNAATPLGLKAMQELQKLNPYKDTATNAMVMFLAINTSSITLISSSTIAFRTAAGAANPTDIVGPTIIATTVSTAVAIVFTKMCEKLQWPKIEAEAKKTLGN